MNTRVLLKLLEKDLQTVPAVVLFGPRQVGKTTLVKQLLESHPEKFLYLDMELPSDRVKLTDSELFLTRLEDKTVIIDEVQFVPDLFPVLRALIDQKDIPGRFMLLGSASPELLQKSAESLAGRVRYRELFPFSISEIESTERDKLWFRGGFPRAFLTANDEEAMQWYADFVRTYTTRDLPLLGLPMPAMQTERLLQMLAHQHGQLLNYSTLSKSLGVSQPTVTNAIYYLEEAMLVKTLKPWHSNTGKRLVKTPKIYIRDSGMLHYLLGIRSFNQLMGHPQAGNSWEGFVIQQIMSHLPANLLPYFYRTGAGAELDLVLAKGNTITHAIEIKLSSAPKLSRGNTESINDLQPEHLAVIIAGEGGYPFRDGWEVYGLNGFLKSLY
jgi:predicted AAA+ superfamily ATPase